MGKILQCSTCGADSESVEFYKAVSSRCKECHKVRVRENRAAKVDYYREYDAKRFREDPRVRERRRRYQKTDAGKLAAKRGREKWESANGDKRAAHIILGNAVRGGRVDKPEKCTSCGAGGRIEGHHDDYTKPLDVTWLCRKCHVQLHRET